MNRNQFRIHAIGLLIGYALQFLTGMLANLFVTIPATHPGSSGSDYFTRSWHSLVWTLAGHGGWELTVHVYLAVGLVLGSLSLYGKAQAMHNKVWAVCGGIAALFTIGALFNGLSFIDFNKDVSSMIMATCWLVAVGAVLAGLITAEPTRPKSGKLKHAN
jgi:hypothetical protein